MTDSTPTTSPRLARKGKRAREIVYGAGLPDDLAAQILDAYRKLQDEYGEEVSLAVRSSATAEDLPTASFAGQQDTFLNVKGEESLLDACRRCFASLFTDRAIHYRIDQGFDHFKVSLSIGVHEDGALRPRLSGVMFSLDTETGFRDVVFVTGAYGLGENVVQGAVDPDEFYVHKPTYDAGQPRGAAPPASASKAMKMVFVEGGTKDTTRNIPTPKADRERRSALTDDDVLTLAGYAVHDRDSTTAGGTVPMDIEWAKDGIDGQLYIVQARPETVASAAHRPRRWRAIVLDGRAEVLTDGAGGRRRGSHPAWRDGSSTSPSCPTSSPARYWSSDTTTPDWEPVMKTAAAIVTESRRAHLPRGDRGSRARHPRRGWRRRRDARACPTASSSRCRAPRARSGRVYRGAVPFQRGGRIEVGDLARPRTDMHAQPRKP